MSSKKKKYAISKASKTEDKSAPVPEETFYQAPDPNTKMTRPVALAGKIDDSKFVIVWPSNINAFKSESEGRKVPKASCCGNPIVAEMSEALTHLKLVHVIEPYKLYPREAGQPNPTPGRVKVRLFNQAPDAEGAAAPYNPEVPTRKALMAKIGQLIPTLTLRAQRLAANPKHMAALQSAAEARAIVKAAGGGKRPKQKKKP